MDSGHFIVCFVLLARKIYIPLYFCLFLNKNSESQCSVGIVIYEHS